MIQRVQSILLLGILILGIAIFFVPIAELVGNGATLKMTANYMSEFVDMEKIGSRFIGVGVLNGLVIILTLVITLLFKKRQLQMKLGKFNILLIALELTAIFLYTSAAQDHDSEKFGGAVINYGIGSFR